MNILLTGCAGFIGSHLTETLLAKGHSVTGIDNFDLFYAKEEKIRNMAAFKSHAQFTFIEGDIRKINDFNTIAQPIELVIHLAAKAGVRPSIIAPQDYVETNITGTLNILEWMKKTGVKKILFGSSSSVYGNRTATASSTLHPFSETDNVDNPISPYAFTKKSCELLTHVYHHLYNFDIFNLRFFTVYGPRQRPDLAIRKFITTILKGNPVHLFGDGSSARDYTYIKDIVSGIVSAAEYIASHRNVYETINLGNNKPVKLLYLVHCIYRTLGAKPDIVFEPMQPGDVDITFADIHKANSLLNYSPATGLEQGITNAFEWVKNNNES